MSEEQLASSCIIFDMKIWWVSSIFCNGAEVKSLYYNEGCVGTSD